MTSGSSNLLDQRKPAPLFPAGEGLRFRGSEGSSLLSTMQKKKSYLFDLPIEMTSVVENNFNDSDNVKLYKAESLPELAPLKARFFFNFSGNLAIH